MAGMTKQYLVFILFSTYLQFATLQNVTSNSISTISATEMTLESNKVIDPGINASHASVRIEPAKLDASLSDSTTLTNSFAAGSNNESIDTPAELPIIASDASVRIEPAKLDASLSDSTTLTNSFAAGSNNESIDTPAVLPIVASDTIETTPNSVLTTLATPEIKDSTTASPTVASPAVSISSADSIPNSPTISAWPTACSERKLDKLQPLQDELSMIKKCCPLGESLSGENLTSPMDCTASSHEFNITPIAVTLYQNCIEDNETIVEMDISAGNVCNRSVHYSESQDDRMLVIQNGSLLIMDSSGVIGFRIFDDYCLDVNIRTGKLDAIVCVSPPIERRIGSSQAIIYTGFMMCSIPCLFFVTFIHFAIDKLNHLHGLCIGAMSFCLGIGFTLHSISQFSSVVEIKLQYAVQYFILAYYMWILVTCFNMVIFLWIYVLRYVCLRTRHKTAHFIVYILVAMGLPIFLVVYTKVKKIPGMPSYFQQGWSESIKSGQRYFIPPVSTVLALCFILLVIAFFGFRKLDVILSARENVSYQLVGNGTYQRQDSCLPKIDRAFAEQVQLNARCLALLYVIVCFTWIFEVVTFYNPGAGDYLGFLEVMNAMQGVFILIIFVFIRKKRDVIASWWHDRGSHNISDGTEMKILNRKEKAEPSKQDDDVEK